MVTYYLALLLSILPPTFINEVHIFRHDLEHATNQLCRDTSKQLKDVNNLTPAETQSERVMP